MSAIWAWSALNVVEEKRLAFPARGIAPLFETVQPLDFGRCKLCIAVPDGFDYRARNRSPASASRPPIRTFSARFLAERGIGAEVVVLSGSVEIAPRLGRADLICDLVSTGSTLAANHLRQVETVLESQAVLIRTPIPIPAEKQDWTRRLLMRIDGVEQVKGSKYIMLHAPRSALPASRTAARQRGADGHSARRPRRPRGGACGVPGKRVLGNARAAEGRGRELRAGSAGREDAGLRATRMRYLDWNIAADARAPTRAARPASAMRAAVASAGGGIIAAVRRGGDAALLELTDASTASRSPRWR